MSDFNLFELLDLNPSAGWDQALFERRLGEKQSEWSGLTAHPKRGMEARRNLQLIPRLREVAADDHQRATHAAEALAAEAGRRVAQLRNLDAALTVIQAKGHVLDSELADLVRKFAAVVSEAEVRARLHVPIVRDPFGTAEGREELDASTARRIRDLLEMVQKRDLYDFLGLAPGSSVAQLHARADEIYKDTQKSAIKGVETTALSQLAGHCRALFSTEADKARYDASLQSARYEPLRELADLAAARTRSLPAATVDALLRHFLGEAADAALVESARSVLRAHALKKGYALEMPVPAPAAPPAPTPAPSPPPAVKSGGRRLLSTYIAAGVAVAVLVVLSVLGTWGRSDVNAHQSEATPLAAGEDHSPPEDRTSPPRYPHPPSPGGGSNRPQLPTESPPGAPPGRALAADRGTGGHHGPGRDHVGRAGSRSAADADADDTDGGDDSGAAEVFTSSSAASSAVRSAVSPGVGDDTADHSHDNCFLPDGSSTQADNATECRFVHRGTWRPSR